MVRQESLGYALTVLAVLYVLSIMYFHLVEGWSFIDAAYFTTMTISTVGYGDIVPHTTLGKLGAIALIFLGISVAFYVITSLGMLREKTLDPHIKRRIDMLRAIASLQSGDVPKEQTKYFKKKIRKMNSLVKIGE